MASLLERRRSPRLQLEVPVRVLWLDYKDVPYVEETQTTLISAHGALVYLRHPVALSARLEITSRTTNRTATARVAWTGELLADGRTGVGIELVAAQGYEFWGPLAVALWEEIQTALPSSRDLARHSRVRHLHLSVAALVLLGLFLAVARPWLWTLAFAAFAAFHLVNARRCRRVRSLLLGWLFAPLSLASLLCATGALTCSWATIFILALLILGSAYAAELFVPRYLRLGAKPTSRQETK